jgi:hypothetical protein
MMNTFVNTWWQTYGFNLTNTRPSFYPQPSCHSEGSSLVFDLEDQDFNFVTTHDLDMRTGIPSAENLLFETMDKLPDG